VASAAQLGATKTPDPYLWDIQVILVGQGHYCIGVVYAVYWEKCDRKEVDELFIS
jgi:hypothetical protein